MQTPEMELLGYRQFLKKDEGWFMPATLELNVSDLTDTLLILGSQLLAVLPEEAAAYSNVISVRFLFLLQHLHLSSNITCIRGQSHGTTRG